MDEELGSKVRLVRCPKCENVLPELHDYSVYKCGACGTVLQASKQGSRTDEFLEKSDEGKVEGVSSKEKLICEKTVSSTHSSPSKAQDKVFVKAINQNNRVQRMDIQHEQGSQQRDAMHSNDRYNPYSRGLLNHRVHENGQSKPPNANREFATFSNPHEGSSNYRSNFPHDFGVNRRVENLDHDRAELIRKIDELKIQLGSSSDRTIYSHLNKCNSYLPEGPYRGNFQPFATDQNVLDPICRDYRNGHALDMGNGYPPNRAMRSSYQQQYHDQFLGHNMGVNRKFPPLQNCVSSLNGPQCSCFQCYTNQQAYLRSTNNNKSNGLYGLYPHNLDSTGVLENSHGNLNGELVKRAVIAHHDKRICHPRTNGAPFLACPSCFVLLSLPKSHQNGQKIRCGACSILISVDLEKNEISIKVSAKLRQVSSGSIGGYGEKLGDDFKVHECDNFIVRAQSKIVEANVLSRDNSVKSARSSERKGPISSYSSFSEDEVSPDSLIIIRENSKSADLALKDDPPLQPDVNYEDFVYSRCGMGNKNKRTSRENSLKDVSIVTKNEVVYSDAAVSEEMEKEDGEMEKEEDQPRMEEERDSFLGGLLKKSFKDLLRPSRTVEMSQRTVFVNGQHLSKRVVKKAEKLAGPIQPGNYWYDYRAGFWGVMGQPCHGIIPPFIEEFNYAMPTKCGAGNTRVFVNGRELHENDLKLFACRGLPTLKDKFYMIEINGRVVDEYTGEELDDLGNLAPTVERVKHGFGMRPRAIVE